MDLKSWIFVQQFAPEAAFPAQTRLRICFIKYIGTAMSDNVEKLDFIFLLKRKNYGIKIRGYFFILMYAQKFNTSARYKDFDTSRPSAGLVCSYCHHSRDYSTTRP